MSKILDLNKSVRDLAEEFPEFTQIMVSLGFTDIAKPAALNTVGRVMTVPRGCSIKGHQPGRRRKGIRGRRLHGRGRGRQPGRARHRSRAQGRRHQQPAGRRPSRHQGRGPRRGRPRKAPRELHSAPLVRRIARGRPRRLCRELQRRGRRRDCPRRAGPH